MMPESRISGTTKEEFYVILYKSFLLSKRMMTKCFIFPHVLLLVKAIREITDTMLAVNAAVNFVIYVVFNRGFRDRLAAHLCCRPVPMSPRSTICGRVPPPTDSSSCCWRFRDGVGACQQPYPITNDVEMMSQRGLTTSGCSSQRKSSQRKHLRHLSAQTDL